MSSFIAQFYVACSKAINEISIEGSQKRIRDIIQIIYRDRGLTIISHK